MPSAHIRPGARRAHPSASTHRTDDYRSESRSARSEADGTGNRDSLPTSAKTPQDLPAWGANVGREERGVNALRRWLGRRPTHAMVHVTLPNFLGRRRRRGVLRQGCGVVRLLELRPPVTLLQYGQREGHSRTCNRYRSHIALIFAFFVVVRCPVGSRIWSRTMTAKSSPAMSMRLKVTKSAT